MYEKVVTKNWAGGCCLDFVLFCGGVENAGCLAYGDIEAAKGV